MFALLFASTAAAQEKDEQVLGPAPSVCVVKLRDSGEFEMQVVHYVMESRIVTRTIDDGGARRAIAEEAVVQVPVYETRLAATEGLKLFDIDGNAIKLEDVKERLARPTPVLTVPGGKIASIYRDLFQMGTLVLDYPGSTPGAPIRSEPPRLVPAPVPAPRPR
jgi:hypothetical protein